MRILLLSALLLFTMACGSSAKKTAKPRVDDATAGAAAKPRPAPQRSSDATVTTSTGENLSWLAPVYFAFDSSELNQPARDTLAKLHDWLAKNPRTSIVIEGHCDEQGTTEYNVALGQRRAQAMTDYLTRLGTDSRRLTAVSFGAERPAVDGKDELAYAKNRRGEFRVGK
jgi:peptidoglycan-associated lipoprotein